MLKIKARTFACSVDDRSAGLVLDIRNGISCYDISTKVKVLGSLEGKKVPLKYR
jgi:hypothetical protein